MADDFIANPGAGGDTFAADDIGGVKFPRSKIVIGADGVNGGDVSSANPMPITAPSAIPVSASSLPLPTGAATEATLASIDGKAPALLTTVPFNNVSAPPVRPVGQDIWNCSFSDVGASIVSAEIDPPGYPITGTGVSFSQASGNLAIVAGTSANQEFLTRSVTSWQGALRMKFSTVLSQRIANNNFAVLLGDLIGEGLTFTCVSAVLVDITVPSHGYTSVNVGQFMLLGGIAGAAGIPGRWAIQSIPDANTIRFTVAGWPAAGSGTLTLFGHSYVRNLFTSTTATNVAFDGQRRGWATGDTTATINTTASPGTIITNEVTGRELFLLDQLRASTTTPTATARASRNENIPDDNLSLYVFVWLYNGTTNPASSTTWTISFMAVEKFANFPVYIEGARANGAINPISVTFPSAQAISGTVTATGITGTVAHDAVGTSNPVRVAARAFNAAPAAVSASGDTCDVVSTMVGAITTKPYAIPEQDWSYAAASGGITNTTGVTVKAAGAAGIRNYVTNIQIANSSAVATDVQIRDGASGTVLWRGYANAAMPTTDITFTTPIRGTAATLLEVACGTTATATYINMQGYSAP